MAFGADATSSTKQAEQFGILSKMKYVVPNISQFQAKELGAAVMGGTYGTQAWWWTEQDKYPLAKLFVEAFEKKNNYKPRWGASEVYVQTLVWADAVERAGSFYPVDVIKALGKRPQGELDLRRGLLPRRRPPDGPPRSGDGRQEAERHEGIRKITSRFSNWCRASRCCRRSIRLAARCRVSNLERFSLTQAICKGGY